MRVAVDQFLLDGYPALDNIPPNYGHFGVTYSTIYRCSRDIIRWTQCLINSIVDFIIWKITGYWINDENEEVHGLGIAHWTKFTLLIYNTQNFNFDRRHPQEEL